MEVLSARQAADLVAPGSTVAICGVVSLMAPEAVVRALGERFRETGAPEGLTVICPCRTGWSGSGTTGLEHLAQQGLVRRLIAASYNARDTPELVRMAMDNRIESYSLPMGLLFRWLRECTAQSPGLLTQVGMGTCFDPATPEAGDVRVNDSAAPLELVKRVQVDGTDCILIRSTKIDVAIIRDTVADRDGNISLSCEPISAGVRQMAMAAKTSGGKVIVAVKSMAERGTLHPRMVKISGAFVDAVVVDPDAIQSQVGYEPAFTGETRATPLPELPLNHQKLILRPAAMELRKGDIVNLGVGMGTHLPGPRNGGSLPAGHLLQRRAWRFRWRAGDGRARQYRCLRRALQPARDPRFHRFDRLLPRRRTGCCGTRFRPGRRARQCQRGAFRRLAARPGGFIDITHRTGKLLLCGSLTSGGLKVECSWPAPDQPQLRIVQEGRNRKFLQRVEQTNLNARCAIGRGQRVMVITERCVFEAHAEGLVPTEIAPGIDVDAHIRPFVDFELKVADKVGMMPHTLYGTNPMQLQLPQPNPRSSSPGSREAEGPNFTRR